MLFSSAIRIYRTSKQDIFPEASKRTYQDHRQGVSRSHVLKNLKHKDYLHTLQTTKSSYATFRTITAHKHAVKTQAVNKLCLSAFDDKRYVLPDGVSTVTWTFLNHQIERGNKQE